MLVFPMGFSKRGKLGAATPISVAISLGLFPILPIIWFGLNKASNSPS